MKKKLIILVLVLIIGGIFVLYKDRLFKRNTDFENQDLLKSHYNGIDCTQLTGETVRPNNDVVETKKQVCVEERAWFENNPSFCSLHSDPDHCYTWMAIKLKNSALCKELGVKTENCIKLVETTKNENTWHWDYIRKGQNPI